ncbi:hypothetical protein [Campylobacter curvus]|uniref:hypothetical protein n=1 Tax=Campylobacter curvus TaxID=200 RepID=UPI00147068B6|nr:hypothetical protein [Campylobacter curvus]
MKKILNTKIFKTLTKISIYNYAGLFFALVFNTYFVYLLRLNSYGEYVLYLSYFSILELIGSLGLDVDLLSRLKNKDMALSDLSFYFFISFFLAILIGILFLFYINNFNTYTILIVALSSLLVMLTNANSIKMSHSLEHIKLTKNNFFMNFSFYIIAASLLLHIDPIDIFFIKIINGIVFNIYLAIKSGTILYILVYPSYIKDSYYVFKNRIISKGSWYLICSSLFLKTLSAFVPIIIANFGSLSLLALCNLADKILSQFLLLFKYAQNLILSYYNKSELVRKFERHKLILVCLSFLLFCLVILCQFLYFYLFVKENFHIDFYLAIILFSSSVLTYPYRTVIGSIFISNELYKLIFFVNLFIVFLIFVIMLVLIVCDMFNILTISITQTIANIVNTILLHKIYKNNISKQQAIRNIKYE